MPHGEATGFNEQQQEAMRRSGKQREARGIDYERFATADPAGADNRAAAAASASASAAQAMCIDCESERKHPQLPYQPSGWSYRYLYLCASASGHQWGFRFGRQQLELYHKDESGFCTELGTANFKRHGKTLPIECGGRYQHTLMGALGQDSTSIFKF